ncbi:MAG: hypothetical protein V4618_18670 [Pseudomonadota bacterium]
MASGRVLFAVALLLSAGSVQAAAPGHGRLALSLRGLDGGGDVVYHPTRWLSLRRSATYVRAQPYDDVVRSAPTLGPRPRAYALAGDLHPFGDAVRVSLGLREDDNGRLLRSTGDRGDIGTARYAPLMSVGLAGEVAEGLFVAGDVGLVGRATARPDDSTIVTPIDIGPNAKGGAQSYRPMVQLSAGYRF